MKLWPLENAVVIAALAATVYAREMPLDIQTAGWVLGSFALHTARSHAGRLREDAGRPEDWTGTLASWMAGGAAILAASAPQRVLLAVPLTMWACHTLYRWVYRRACPAQPSSWSREDD